MKKITIHIQAVPSRVFLVAFIVSSLVCISALRSNNQQMINLRTAVYVADKDNKDVNAALNSLRLYVYSHMNTSLSSGGNTIKPPIQLKYTYQRLQTAGQVNADAVKAQVYTDAQNYCQTQNPSSFSGRARVACVQDYVISHVPQQAQAVDPALYQFDFISPAWSPDLAGWTLVASITFFVAFMASFLLGRIISTKIR